MEAQLVPLIHCQQGEHPALTNLVVSEGNPHPNQTKREKRISRLGEPATQHAPVVSPGTVQHCRYQMRRVESHRRAFRAGDLIAAGAILMVLALVDRVGEPFRHLRYQMKRA
jgi:hypothetical protein